MTRFMTGLTQIVSLDEDDVVCSTFQSLEASLPFSSRCLQLCHLLLQRYINILLLSLLFVAAAPIIILEL